MTMGYDILVYVSTSVKEVSFCLFVFSCFALHAARSSSLLAFPSAYHFLHLPTTLISKRQSNSRVLDKQGNGKVLYEQMNILAEEPDINDTSSLLYEKKRSTCPVMILSPPIVWQHAT
jgi:hypothetical protein